MKIVAHPDSEPDLSGHEHSEQEFITLYREKVARHSTMPSQAACHTAILRQSKRDNVRKAKGHRT